VHRLPLLLTAQALLARPSLIGGFVALLCCGWFAPLSLAGDNLVRNARPGDLRCGAQTCRESRGWRVLRVSRGVVLECGCLFTPAVSKLAMGDLPGALEAADKLVDADRQNSEARILRAVIHLCRADYAKGRIDAERADSRETVVAAAEILFQCSWMQGDPDGALRAVEACLRHDPSSANAYIAKADAMVLLDKSNEARKALMKAVHLHSESALAYARLAMLDLAERQILAAKAWVKKAQGINPDLPEVKIAVAHWYLAIIRPDLAEQLAVEVWTKANHSPPVRLQALTILAQVAATRDKWEEVDKYVAETEKLRASSPEVLVAAAEIAFAFGEQMYGMRYLERAEKLTRGHPLVKKLRVKCVPR
jgi:tetratricopeptide (TPR) repeat protein